MEGCSDVDAEEAADDVAQGEGVGLEVAMGTGFALVVALYGTDFGVFLVEG